MKEYSTAGSLPPQVAFSAMNWNSIRSSSACVLKLPSSHVQWLLVIRWLSQETSQAVQSAAPSIRMRATDRARAYTSGKVVS